MGEWKEGSGALDRLIASFAVGLDNSWFNGRNCLGLIEARTIHFWSDRVRAHKLGGELIEEGDAARR